jgi:hypothetical protein
VRDAYRQLGEIVSVLDDLECDDVPATPTLRKLALALRDEASEAAQHADDLEDAGMHRCRLVCADAVLQRLDTLDGGDHE